MRFLKSFQYAVRGFVYCINNERNMRIHTVVAVYVFAFSFFFRLTRAGYAALFLTFACVMAAELFNTVSEELCDMIASSFHPAVRIIKDMASGGVLVGAFFAVCVGISLFWQPEGFRRMAGYFLSKPAMAAVLLLFTAGCAVFIALGPLGIRDRIRGRNSPAGKGKRHP